MKNFHEKNIELTYYPALELIFSVARISLNHEYIEDKEKGISIDKDIEKWVNESLADFDSQQKEIMNFYFDEDGYLGLGLSKLKEKISKDCSPVEFINYLDKLPPKKLAYYLLVGGYDGKLKEEEIEKSNNYHNIYEWITKNFVVTSRGKWKVFRILSKPEEVKKELCNFLRYFYENIFIDFFKKQNVINFMKDYLKRNEELLKEAFLRYTEHILSKEAQKKIFNSNNELSINVSYFAGIGDIFIPEQNRFTLGYKYPDKKLPGVGHQILKYSQLFKALSDETRLKLLLELKERSKYLTEISNSLDISSPTVKYHLEKFINSGVVEIKKAEKKKYYRLRKDRIREMLNLISDIFNINDN
ncbi:MAG: ArsR/SmtB family transcription factor [Bacillota bacterium]